MKQVEEGKVLQVLGADAVTLKARLSRHSPALVNNFKQMNGCPLKTHTHKHTHL